MEHPAYPEIGPSHCAATFCRDCEWRRLPAKALHSPQTLLHDKTDHQKRQPVPAMNILRSQLIIYSLICLANLGAMFTRAQVVGSIGVYPTTSSLEFGATRQFVAYVPINPNSVEWLVNDVVGGNASVGTITPAGLYQAPSIIPAANTITIKARSTAFPTSAGAATATIIRKYPYLWSAAPSKLQAGNYSVTFNGANFAPDSQATANGADIQTVYVSPNKLIVSGNAATLGTIQFAVRQPGPGAVTGNSVAVPVTAAVVTVAVSPSTASMPLGTSQAFASTVTGNANTAVTWSVNGVPGGSASVGLITSAGVYSAPGTMPAPNPVTIRAASVAIPSAYADATVMLTLPVTVSISPTSASIQTGANQAFAATVNNTPNTAVYWTVNGIAGGSAAVGTISTAGIYAAPDNVPAPNTVTIRATSAASPLTFAQASVTVTAPPPPAVWLAGARFLEQSSFGPTPATLAKVQQIGIEAYLQEQLAMPENPIPTPAANDMGLLRNWALHNYTTAPDQLRQRVAYALSQIVVTSANKLIYPNAMLPWLRLLNHHAFGNYRDLLRDVTVCPSMGKFLDLANSMKPGMAGGANENYARELMQLFTIGLWELNLDGSQVKDANNKPISAYNQATVQQVSLALTGWTYANNAYEDYSAPMVAIESRHDTTAKSYLGTNSPTGLTVEQDLDFLLNVLIKHPNTAPFIATRLIRSLVTSNPTPGYVARVASVFVDNGAGVRGDLKAVVAAILTDAEARNDNPGATEGRLKDSILHACGFLRALNGHFTSDQQVTYLFDYMAQSVLNPPSVFSWFSPLYRVPKSPLFGPEFQIYSPTDAALRGNLFHYILSSSDPGVPVDLSPFQPYGNDMAGLVEAANQKLLYGRMPDGLKQVLITAAAPGYSAKTRIETVLYLTALSGQYAIQR